MHIYIYVYLYNREHTRVYAHTVSELQAVLTARTAGCELSRALLCGITSEHAARGFGFRVWGLGFRVLRKQLQTLLTMNSYC